MKSYGEIYKEGNLRIFLDISTYCNAGCPQCHRTNQDGLKTVDWLPQVNWTMDQFEEAYPPETVKKVNEWEFCGTWGDPVMNPHLYEMCYYISRYNKRSDIFINTNGSIQTEAWWRDLGKLNVRMKVYWAVEGTTQEVHEKYRRKTNLDKIKRNMIAFHEGGGVNRGFVLVHKHNQHELENINKMLTQELFCEEVVFVENNRFIKNKKFTFIDENGELESIEQMSEDVLFPDIVKPLYDHRNKDEDKNKL